jgi:hypothetical protein
MCSRFCCSSSSFPSIISVFCDGACIFEFHRNSFGDIIITLSRCGGTMRKVLVNATRD